jgi:hypothetical protein
MMTARAAAAQAPQPAPTPAPQPAKTPAFTLAVTYAPEYAQLAPGLCGCFWMQGAGMDAGLRLHKDFGLAVSISGAHVANAAPGVDVNRIVYLAGERYTHASTLKQAARGRQLEYFGQWLLGSSHGFDGVYPGAGGARSSANAFAMQGGGGVNLYLNPRVGLRLLEAEYLRSDLPNGASNTQNDLRLAFGVSYRIGKR